MKIAIIQIILGRYNLFWKNFYISSEHYFCKDDQKDYFVFSDKKLPIENKNVKLFEQDYLGWPFSTLYRYHMICRIEKQLFGYDAIVFFNANTIFKKKVCYEEFFGDNSKKLVAGVHPLWFNPSSNKLPTEKRMNSECFVESPKIYVQGCINGGKAESFLNVTKKMKNMIDKDLSKGILAIWHDESYWNFIINKLMLEDESSINLLGYEYLLPSNLINKFKNVKPKIIMFSKDKYGNMNDFRNNIYNKSLNKKIFFKLKNILSFSINKNEI